MDKPIQIIVKPDWVSWDDIHNVLVQAHAVNRTKGINMRKPSLPGEEIKKEIGDDGIMLVALDGDKVVGSAALLVKENTTWYNNGPYGYLCFAAVLPEYNGMGIYKCLCEKREKIARERGVEKLCFDTHHLNKHVIEINETKGFKKVDVKLLHDHWNVVLFKWMEGCPYNSIKCVFEFYIRVAKMLLIKTIKSNHGCHNCRR